jgi:biopolymer transport protein ExbD
MPEKRKLSTAVDATEEGGLPITPMIDVIFQLLIFFMVNINFRSTEGLLKAFLPRAEARVSAPEKQEDKVFITLTEPSRGQLSIAVNNQLVGGSTPAEQLRNLGKKLKDIKDSFAKMPPVIIDADARLRYRYVIGALNECGRLKLEDVMFMVPTPR